MSKSQARLRLAELGLVLIDCGTADPRRYAQSTSGRISSHRTRPPLSRSKAIASDSPNRPLVESFLRMYPMDVPHRAAKDFCSESGRELTYSRNDSMGDYTLPTGTAQSSHAGNWPFPGGGYVVEMGKKAEHLKALYAVRRRRLAQLVEEYGSQAELARALSQSNMAVLSNESYLSRLLSGKPPSEGGKNIGGDTAAEIERLTNKPAGWLSRESDDEPVALVDVNVWNALTREEQLQLRSTIDAMIAGFMSNPKRRRKAG